MFKRLGVRESLFLAFFGISAFAVLAAAAALYAFLEVETVLEQVTQRDSPAAMSSLEVSRQTERLLKRAPGLLTVTTTGEWDQLSNIITDESEHLEELLKGFEIAEVETTTLASIEWSVRRLRTNMDSLKDVVEKKLRFRRRNNESLRGLLNTHRKTQALLIPRMVAVDRNIKKLNTTVEALDRNPEQRAAAVQDLNAALTAMVSLQGAQREASAVYQTLLESASTKRSDRLQLLESHGQVAVKNLKMIALDFDPDLQVSLEAQIEEFSKFLEGSNSLLVARSAELSLASDIEQVLIENSWLSEEITVPVNNLVDQSKQNISEAFSKVQTVLQTSTLVLGVAVAFSIISSVAIVWLYVGRNLIARLTALSDSMLAIANGDLDRQMPKVGNDELGRMADALIVFRDTAIEVRETNLREISLAQRRLTDAIESISEGFSLYDSDDHLVVCNRRYHELLYPGMSDVVQPGTSFEAVIRGAVERDLVEEVHNYESVDDWVAERLQRHRNPSGTYVQQRGERQWIQISERRTDDGGYVAVYTDITEVKDREAELAEKSNALEQLSNQLAKYLSPQIYNSIFLSKQEVKIASSRKKLTVFFSDIADFTETADRLQSEELTQLLNHYLTEMSQIALEYGATIDKYFGDAMVIFFGDPETKGVKEDALACVKMAIAMRKRMGDLQNLWRESGIGQPLRCRMGIHTDYCTVGNFGSETRMDYTIIGGGVNLASRLETAATPGEILISYETYAHISDQIFCEEHGEIDVKGIAYPVVTHRVVDLHENLDEEDRSIRTELPHLKIDADVKLMSEEERKAAATALQEAANRLWTDAA